MALPQTIRDVEQLETDLRERGFNPNDYLPATMQMKFLVHDHSVNPIEGFESFMQKEAKKIADLTQNNKP